MLRRVQLSLHTGIELGRKLQGLSARQVPFGLIVTNLLMIR